MRDSGVGEVLVATESSILVIPNSLTPSSTSKSTMCSSPTSNPGVPELAVQV